MTYPDDEEAIRAIQTRLRARFADSDTGYAAHYTRYGGADVISLQDEPTEPQQVGKPFLSLLQTDGSESDWSAADDKFRDVTARVVATSTASSGAQVGTANPVSSDSQLSRDLQREMNESSEEWDALGIYDIECRPQTEQIDADGVHRIPHSVTFKYQVG